MPSAPAPCTPTPKVYIATSGWQHDSFAGRFYPDDCPQSDRLSFYADTFDSVEVNNPFYQSPDEETLHAWGEQTPDDFTDPCECI